MQPYTKTNYKTKALKRRARRFTREVLIPGLIKLTILFLLTLGLLELGWRQFDRELTRRECLVYKSRTDSVCNQWKGGDK